MRVKLDHPPRPGAVLSWSFVTTHEGIYEPDSGNNERLITLYQLGRSYGSYVTLYLGNNQLEQAMAASWSHRMFRQTTETIQIRLISHDDA